jgi:hypothetical protein
MEIRSVTEENLVESWGYDWNMIDIDELKLFESFEDAFDSIF